MDTVAALRKYNRWRRGLDAWHEDAGPSGEEIGRLIDATCGELERLHGERTVFAELMYEAAMVIHTIDGDDDDEERKLRDLQERLERMALHVRGLMTPNAEVSGAGTASAGLPGWQANGETE